MTSVGEPPSYHLIVNPISGNSAAPQFVAEHVRPLLDALQLPYTVYNTECTNDGARIAKAIKAVCRRPSETRIVIAGGDGTTREVMEGLLETERAGEKLGRWGLVIIPMGTANALHASLFPPGHEPVPLPPSLRPLLESKPPEVIHSLSSLILALADKPPRRVPITTTRLISPSSAPESAKPLHSHIVVSTALHAALLDDSEALRQEHPGLERFKMAAAMNISTFFRADVQLLPVADKGVMQYDPRKGEWVAPFTAGSSPDTLDTVILSGPFAYLVSGTTTPRFEPTFVILPTLGTLPKDDNESSMDIAILRPMRDPRVRAAIAGGGDGSQEWASRCVEVLGAAYRDGKHADLTYPLTVAHSTAQDVSNSQAADNERHLAELSTVGAASQGAAEDRGGGDVVVEVFRCSGFVWTPTDESHEKSHLVCTDGEIHRIPARGHADVVVAKLEANGDGFWVWG